MWAVFSSAVWCTNGGAYKIAIILAPCQCLVAYNGGTSVGHGPVRTLFLEPDFVPSAGTMDVGHGPVRTLFLGLILSLFLVGMGGGVSRSNGLVGTLFIQCIVAYTSFRNNSKTKMAHCKSGGIRAGEHKEGQIVVQRGYEYRGKRYALTPSQHFSFSSPQRRRGIASPPRAPPPPRLFLRASDPSPPTFVLRASDAPHICFKDPKARQT